MNPAPKHLFFDTETSLAIYAAYPSNKPQYLGAHNLLQDWFMICAAWQWGGQKNITSVSLIDDMKRFKKNPFDDYHVVKTLADCVREADCVIGHNMARFDMKKLTARLIYHRLDPLPPVKIIDTLAIAKSIAGFSHNSLAHLGKHFGVRQKKIHNPDMWLRIIRGDIEAVKEAIPYCKGDIPPLVDLYNVLLPYAKNNQTLNLNLWRGEGIDCCPKCSGDNLQSAGFRATVSGKYRRFRCMDCGSWSMGKVVKRVSIK